MEKASPARSRLGLNAASIVNERNCPKCASSEVVGDYCTQCHVKISMYQAYLEFRQVEDGWRTSTAAMLKSRSLMFTVSSLWVAAILVVLIFRGGGAISVDPRPADLLVQQAASKAAAGDYHEAVRLYRKAILKKPEDVSLWYALGVALSHLDRRQETVEAFQFVVRRGNPDADQVRAARHWLDSAAEAADLPIPASHGDPGELEDGARSRETWM